MPHELIFSATSLTAMGGWLLLLLSPLMPRWSDRIAGYLLPLGLCLTYGLLLLLLPAQGGGDYASLAGVAQLFSDPSALLAGWVHYLAFDLFIGGWICRHARQQGLPFWLVLPALPLTFLFGPLGLLVYLAAERLMRHLRPTSAGPSAPAT